MVRTFAVLAFIAGVGGAAVYVANRPTVARGDVLAADLMESNAKILKSLDCDPEIPVGVDGARFWCRAQFRIGAVKRLEFKMDRAGGIKQIGEEDGAPSDTPARVDQADPWSD